jgi:hypothetical protein
MSSAEEDSNESRDRMIGRLLERSETIVRWMHDTNYRLETGARDMSDLRAADARIEAKLDLIMGSHLAPMPTPEKRRWTHSFVELCRDGKEFAEAVASPKELALASNVLANPGAWKDLIASFIAGGP